MHYFAIRSATFRRFHTPFLSSRRYQHCTSTRAGPTELIPAHRNGTRAAGTLASKNGGVDRRLLDLHARPIGIEFFRDDQREGGLDPLSDFRAFRIDDDRAIR